MVRLSHHAQQVGAVSEFPAHRPDFLSGQGILNDRCELRDVARKVFRELKNSQLGTIN
jgi:hypothetical protein